jgi:excisionase family DNA binding protein
VQDQDEDAASGACTSGSRFVATLSPNGEAPHRKVSKLPRKIKPLDWSGRQDLNLRPPGPEPEREEFHGVTSGGTGSQPVETTGAGEAADSDTVAPNGYGHPPFGAPVVRDLAPDPGPHERLLTAREVASRLRVSKALVYKLCERNELPAVRIGGALRFQREVVESFIARRL